MFVSTLELLTQASARPQGVSLAGLSEEVLGKGNRPFTRDKCPLKVNGESMESKICFTKHILLASPQGPQRAGPHGVFSEAWKK